MFPECFPSLRFFFDDRGGVYDGWMDGWKLERSVFLQESTTTTAPYYKMHPPLQSINQSHTVMILLIYVFPSSLSPPNPPIHPNPSRIDNKTPDSWEFSPSSYMDLAAGTRPLRDSQRCGRPHKIQNRPWSEKSDDDDDDDDIHTYHVSQSR